MAATTTPDERTPGRGLKVVAATMALGLAIAFSATAMAGKGSGTAWIGLKSVNGAGSVAAASDPRLGDWVTFSTVVPRNVNNPRIEVLCYQNGDLVFGMAGAIDYEFLLGGGGSTWKDNGGAADCVANLYYFSWKANKTIATVLASTSFHADA